MLFQDHLKIEETTDVRCLKAGEIRSKQETVWGDEGRLRGNENPK